MAWLPDTHVIKFTWENSNKVLYLEEAWSLCSNQNAAMRFGSEELHRIIGACKPHWPEAQITSEQLDNRR